MASFSVNNLSSKHFDISENFSLYEHKWPRGMNTLAPKITVGFGLVPSLRKHIYELHSFNVVKVY